MEATGLHEECGVIGVWHENGAVEDGAVREIIYNGLYGVQHRGQQSSGTAFLVGDKIVWNKDLGLAPEVIARSAPEAYGKAKAGIGHCGYIVASELSRESVQPLVFKYKKGQFAIGYNGCLINAKELRAGLESEGFLFQSGSDAEIISILVSKARIGTHGIEKALTRVMEKLVGAYSLVIMTPRKIVAARDSRGMKPLCLGKLRGGYIVASESSVFNTVKAEFVRDIMPGEVIAIDDKGLKPIFTKAYEKTAMCIFEHVYLARTDSVIDGLAVYEARLAAGRVLADESPVEADVVIGVPDSGLTAALGYSAQSGIQYAEGLVKNRYIGRTFIQPSQKMRESAVGLKLSVIKCQVEGKRVILVDDSIVRGTTCKKIVAMLKEQGGAKEVHVRVSSPSVRFPCKYGIDTRDADVLLANKMGLEGLKKEIKADSLAFLSEAALDRITEGAKSGFCKACFNGDYPLTEQ